MTKQVSVGLNDTFDVWFNHAIKIEQNCVLEIIKLHKGLSYLIFRFYAGLIRFGLSISREDHFLLQVFSIIEVTGECVPRQVELLGTSKSYVSKSETLWSQEYYDW